MEKDDLEQMAQERVQDLMASETGRNVQETSLKELDDRLAPYKDEIRKREEDAEAAARTPANTARELPLIESPLAAEVVKLRERLDILERRVDELGHRTPGATSAL